MNVRTNPSNSRRMRRGLVPLAVGAASVLAAAALAAGSDGASPPAAPADGPSGVRIEPLVHATLGDRVRAHGDGISIKTGGARDVLATKITVAPGGTFGWHTHPGPVLVAVASGTLTLYEPRPSGCRRSEVKPQHGFVEGGGHVHLARNEGSKPVQLFATFLARTGTKDFLSPTADPGTCRVRR